jgi:hypothetical protein
MKQTDNISHSQPSNHLEEVESGTQLERSKQSGDTGELSKNPLVVANKSVLDVKDAPARARSTDKYSYVNTTEEQ